MRLKNRINVADKSVLRVWVLFDREGWKIVDGEGRLIYVYQN